MFRIPDGMSQRIGCVFALAMVAAPFLGLQYGPNAGLAVATAALAATAFVAWDVSRSAPGDEGRRMAFAAMLNGVLAGITLVLLLYRLVFG